MDLLVLAGLVVAICWGFTDYLVVKPIREVGFKTNPYVLLFSTIAIAPALLYFGLPPNFNPWYLIIALVSPISTFIGFYFGFRALKYGNLAMASPVVNSYPVVTVLGSLLILKDRLSQIQLVSAAATIFGIILLSAKASGFKTKQKIVVAGIGSALIAMLAYGIPGLFAAAYITFIGYAIWSFMGRGLGCVFSFTYGKLKKEDLSFPKRKYLPSIALAGVLDGAGLVLFYYALYSNTSLLPILSTLTAFAGGVGVLCAFALLRERPEWNQWLGITLAIIGVVVLSYFS